MAQVNPYLVFNGNCEEVFSLYQSVFGGEFKEFSRYKDMPPMGEQTISPEGLEKILHVSLPISSETILMGSDSHPLHGEVTLGHNMSISVNAESKEEADKIFNGLSAGGKITMPLADTFWGAYFGMWTDKFGIAWMINFDKKP